jgi:signal transduction histidine kinase
VSVAVSDTAGGEVLVTIADTGMGIPAAEQDEVFSRFHRARNVAAIPGNGLGLAIVKHVLQRHGGSLQIESEEGRGSTFTCHFPPTRLLPAA